MSLIQSDALHPGAPMHPTAPKLRRVYADGPDGQVHYYDGGGPDNGKSCAPLLLLHQSPASSSDWFAIIPFLQVAGLRVIAMDTPGMGLSDPPPRAPVIADYADIVPLVLDHAGVASAHLLGHHTGAQIAIDAAARHGDRVRSASLYGAPMMTEAELEAYWNQIVPREKDGALFRPVPGGNNLTEHFTRVEGMFGTVAAQRSLLNALTAGPLFWYGHNAALRYDMAPALRAATQPLLLIGHPGEMLLSNTQAAAALRPDAELAMLELDCAMAMDADPKGLAETVIRFIARVEAGGAG
jgi:pimeloyl-ACP methyl ester carboxylesterase